MRSRSAFDWASSYPILIYYLWVPRAHISRKIGTTLDIATRLHVLPSALMCLLYITSGPKSTWPWVFPRNKMLVCSLYWFTATPTYCIHYNDVIMGAIASQITSPTIVYSIVYSDADQRKHPRTNGQLRGKCFHLMTSSCRCNSNGKACAYFASWQRGKQEWIYGCCKCLLLTWFNFNPSMDT